jgi:hypothetical protein
MAQTKFWQAIPPLVLLLALPAPRVRAQGGAESPPPPAPAPVEGQPDQPPQPGPAPAEGSGQDAGPRADLAPGSGLGFSPLFNPAVGHAPLRADYRVTWFPDEPVAGQPTRLGYVQNDLGLLFPIYQDGCNEWTGSAHVRDEIFHTGAVLPDSGRPFPDDLWNVRLGTAYRHLFDNGWIAGGSVSVGSASNRPFHSIDEMTAGVNAFLRVPQGEHNAWLFSLNYSPTSELAFPIPGVAYVWQPSDQFCANIGLPLQIVYRPLDDLTFDVSYMLVRTIHARATYRLSPLFLVYGGFDWANESYFLADRVDTRERFFYYDKRLSAGLRANLGRHASLDLAGGYVFDRFYFQGRSYSDSQNDRVTVGDGPFVSLQLLTRW